MNLFRRGEESFLRDLAPYRGTHRQTDVDMQCWEVNDPDKEPFRTIIETACHLVSQCPSVPRSALLLIDIFIRGATFETSSVYLMLAGSTVKQRKSIVKHLKRSPLLQKYTGLKIDQWDWPPETHGIELTGKIEKMRDTELVYKSQSFEIRRPAPVSSNENIATNDYITSLYTPFQILATNDASEESKAGTLSCLVPIGNRAFIICSAHIFLPRPAQQIEELEQCSEDMEECELRDSSEVLEATGVTQSDRVFPSGADDLYMFSSEYDFALLPLPDDLSLHTGLRPMSMDKIQSILPGEVPVSVTTLSLGVMYGSLEGRPIMMQLPYSSKFVRLYPAKFPEVVKKGDCGSAVVCRSSGNIYGFVVAASKEAKIVYVVAARDIIREIDMRSASLTNQPGDGDIEKKPVDSLPVPSKDATELPLGRNDLMTPGHLDQSHYALPHSQHRHGEALQESKEQFPLKQAPRTEQSPESFSQVDEETGLEYSLEVVQQPIRARSCGFENRRYPVTPAPCVRLIIKDPETGREVDYNTFWHAMFVLSVELWDEHGLYAVNLTESPTGPEASTPLSGQYFSTSTDSQPITQIHKPHASQSSHKSANSEPQVAQYGHDYPPLAQQAYSEDSSPGLYGPIQERSLEHSAPKRTAPHRNQTQPRFTRNIVGGLAASAFRLTDTEHKAGIWFVFSDISIRSTGTFRFKFSFVDVALSSATRKNSRAPVLSSCFSDSFVVYSANEFPGPCETTALSKRFALQGIKIKFPEDYNIGGKDKDDK